MPRGKKKAAPVEEPKLCNHQNLHAQPVAVCVLEPGHKGNHSDGKYAWSDAAGTPIKKHG
jgi:hypothetical protein